MVPTLRPGDRLRVDTLAYRSRPPSVGDIVVLVDPEVRSRWLIKRVAALGPGVYRRDDRPPVPLPDRTVFVIGEAEDRSRDSRQFGPAPIDTLLGRAVACYAPAHRRRAL